MYRLCADLLLLLLCLLFLLLLTLGVIEVDHLPLSHSIPIILFCHTSLLLSSFSTSKNFLCNSISTSFVPPNVSKPSQPFFQTAQPDQSYDTVTAGYASVVNRAQKQMRREELQVEQKTSLYFG